MQKTIAATMNAISQVNDELPNIFQFSHFNFAFFYDLSSLQLSVVICYFITLHSDLKRN